MKAFASDNYASIHPKILKSIEAANAGHAKAYGADPWTEKLNDKIKDLFGSHVEVFPVFNGSGANVLSLKTLTKPYEAVLCTHVAHINVDECGAPEAFMGVKLIDLPCLDGKLSAEKINPFTLNYGNEHQVQAKVLSLTQSTERGTVYQIKELESLKAFAKGKGMKIFMDGARFANATASLGVSPRKIVEAAGLDILSLGGTKNGLMLGELVLVFNPEIAAEMKFYRKQAMQLASKMRFISAQFLAYFENDLWLENATHANAMAKTLAEKLSDIENIVLCENVEANSVFVKIPRNAIEPLQKDYPFYVWDEEINEVRWMCSFDTTEDEINRFVKRVKEVIL